VFDWHERFKEGRESLQDENGKVVLQLPEQKNRQKSFKTVSPKIEL
jgi:hypothetical protein